MSHYSPKLLYCVVSLTVILRGIINCYIAGCYSCIVLQGIIAVLYCRVSWLCYIAGYHSWLILKGIIAVLYCKVS